MSPHFTGGFVRIATLNCVDDGTMLLMGFHKPSQRLELGMSVRRASLPHAEGQFGKKRIVRPRINRFMKPIVEGDVSIQIASRYKVLAFLLERQQIPPFCRCHGDSRPPRTEPLELSSDGKHFVQFLFGFGTHDQPVMGPRLGQTYGLKLAKRFPQRGPRYTEPCRKRRFIQRLAGEQAPMNDITSENFSDHNGFGRLTHVAPVPICMRSEQAPGRLSRGYRSEPIFEPARKMH